MSWGYRVLDTTAHGAQSLISAVGRRPKTGLRVLCPTVAAESSAVGLDIDEPGSSSSPGPAAGA